MFELRLEIVLGFELVIVIDFGFVTYSVFDSVSRTGMELMPLIEFAM